MHYTEGSLMSILVVGLLMLGTNALFDKHYLC